MSDAQIREQERQAAIGDRDAAVRLLLERVRSEPDFRRRVERAAYLGDEAARLAFGPLCLSVHWQTRYGEGAPLTWESIDDLTLEVWSKNLAKPGATSAKVTCTNSECKDGKVQVLDGRIYPGRAGPTMRPTGETADCTWLDCNGTGKITGSVPDREFLVRCAVAAARCALGPAFTGAHQQKCRPCFVGNSCVDRDNAVAAIEAAESTLLGHKIDVDDFTNCGTGWAADTVRLAAIPYDQMDVPMVLTRCLQAAARDTSCEAVRQAIREHVVPWCLS